ncbi:MAG: helix-turn-helix domain-containing protein [Candidatus Woesearchaeota archaeon]|jgi:sugar-specific transcriptional regulator TrmB|nr:helix-turn-helix domain-containing protein [Candidatus Woesearchaeota archaeon]MDP7323169.1 helix-turn-helix domain-containing protein [Candidatus Woesearchaeota archaeon]MDP7457324.1 helix-turn-helix domain-containing protein [Candidatus Woesearchaeota archaeon]
MDIKATLGRIGLTENEIKVYLCLVDYGLSKAGKVAKITEIQRSSCYMAINSLVHKGLVSYHLEGIVKHFQATSPHRLLEYVDEQRESIKQIVPDLGKRHKLGKKEGQVRLFKGKRGVEAVFMDIIRTGVDNDVFGDDGQLRKNMPIFCEKFVRDQNRLGITTRLLSRVGRDVSYSKGSIYRLVDKDVVSPVATNIYKDKIAIIVWTDEPEAIIIENEAAARAYKAYFEFMWKHAMPVKKKSK